jgi:hypothetical protein
VPVADGNHPGKPGEDRGSGALASCWLADPLFGEAIHGLSESVGIRVSGIEVAADPLQSLLMAGIGYGIQELVVIPWTIDILWRAASGCFGKTGIGDAWHGIGYALNTDGMFPDIVEVVEVFERSGADILQSIDKELMEAGSRTIGNVRQHVSEQARGSTSFNFAVTVSEYTAAARSRSDPANSHAFLPRAMPRNARSAALFVRQILPSSRNRLKEAQRFSMQSVAFATSV